LRMRYDDDFGVICLFSFGTPESWYLHVQCCVKFPPSWLTTLIHTNLSRPSVIFRRLRICQSELLTC
jgi:hypothetical protein